MMISPKMYVAQFENATYNEMINKRDGLIRYILHFEKMEKVGAYRFYPSRFVGHQENS